MDLDQGLNVITSAQAGERLEFVRTKMRKAQARFDGGGSLDEDAVKLVAVSKTKPITEIVPFLQAGQRVFGENRVQEADVKWPELRKDYSDIELHLLGPLQTNKVKDAVRIFDVVQSVDRMKVARALDKEMKAQGKQLNCFVQVNIGGEEQKGGMAPQETEAFVAELRAETELNIVGLMCIPPAGLPAGPFFAQLRTLAEACGLPQLSMGMSSDYPIGIQMGATCVRVGTEIFGARA